MPFIAILMLTFRDLWAKKITLGLFLVSTLAWILLAFALNLDIVEGSLAGVRIFGQDAGLPQDAVRDEETGELLRQALSLEGFVIRIEAFVAGAAYWLGTLLGLFATAPLFTEHMERGRIDLLLSKPLSRARLLGGHVLGVWSAGLVLLLYLLGMVWLVISIKTGVWNPDFFLTVLVVLSMFAVMYSVVLLFEVITQSTAVSLIAAYGLIFTSIILAAKDQLMNQINPPWRQVFLGFYHTLPNFAEVTQLVAQLSGVSSVTNWYPFLSSALFGTALYAVAFLWFGRRDF